MTRITIHYRLNGGSGQTAVADELQRVSRDVPEALLKGPRQTLLGYLQESLQQSHGPGYAARVMKIEWGLKSAQRWAVPEELWPSPQPRTRLKPLPSRDDGVQLPRWR